jgi:hypothetical protein
MSEPIPEQPPVEPVAEPVEPGWQGPSQDEWESTQAQLQQYAQMFQQTQQQQQAYPAAPDPFSETFQADLDAYINYRMAGSQQLEQEIRLAQAEDWAHEHLDQLATSGGEFDRDAAYARANMILMQSGGDPVAALDQAAKDVREYEQRVGQAFYDRQIEQLRTNAGAPRGLPAGQVGAAQTVPTGGAGVGPYAVTRKFFPQGGQG